MPVDVRCSEGEDGAAAVPACRHQPVLPDRLNTRCNDQFRRKSRATGSRLRPRPHRFPVRVQTARSGSFPLVRRTPLCLLVTPNRCAGSTAPVLAAPVRLLELSGSGQLILDSCNQLAGNRPPPMRHWANAQRCARCTHKPCGTPLLATGGRGTAAARKQSSPAGTPQSSCSLDCEARRLHRPAMAQPGLPTTPCPAKASQAAASIPSTWPSTCSVCCPSTGPAARYCTGVAEKHSGLRTIGTF